MRYFNTERLGVIATDKIVTKEIGWIFREQPICDVGIDAIIEQVELNNPKGKFIALQIKSGEGNFHFSNDKLIYYASNIHRDYWLNLNIPILLIAHLPTKDETFWSIINSETLKKTKNKWKIEISTKTKFDANSKTELTQLISPQLQTSYTYHKAIFDEKLVRYNLFTKGIDACYTHNNPFGVFRFLSKLDTEKLASEVANSLREIRGIDIKLLLLEDISMEHSMNSITFEKEGVLYIVINGKLNNCWKNFSIIHSLVETYLDLGESLSAKNNNNYLQAFEKSFKNNVEAEEALITAISIIVAPKDRKLVYEIGKTLIDDAERPFTDFDLSESYQVPESIIKFYREKLEKNISM